MRIPQQSLVDRPRLLNLLQKQGDALIINIQAPAGYGKTSLLQQWAQHCMADQAIVAWLSLDKRDCDPMSFALHLVQALEESGWAVRDSLGSAQSVQKYYGWQAIIQELCDSFVDCDRICYFFLDDVQYIKDCESLACIKMLISDAPTGIRLVISSREDIGLPLGRLRALGHVVDLHTEDLQFAEEETLVFLASRGQQNLAPNQVHTMQNRAEGWIAGIKLFSMAVSLEAENSEILENLTGERRQIADFFVEDVFSRQPEDLQIFLMHTSVLDRFCPAMCDAVLQIENSRVLIDQCESAGLFLQTLDQTRTWYRYHHLFSEFLRRQLQDRSPRASVGLYRSAAQWLTHSGLHAEAFDSALKGQDPIYAAQILDTHCESMFAAGMQQAIHTMANRLPQHILALHPRLMLIVAWRLTAQWRLEEACSLVAVSRDRLKEMERVTPDLPEIAELRFLVKHRESQISHATYDIENLETECASVIKESLQLAENPYLMGSFYNSLQYAQREQFKLADIDKLDALARTQLEKTNSQHGEIFIAGISGPSYLLLGRMDKAQEVLVNALSVVQRLAGRDDPVGAVVALPLAYIHYERNEIASAEALVEQHMPLAGSAGFVDQLVMGWIVQSRLQFLKGDVVACLSSLEEAADLGARHDLELLRIAAHAEQLRVLLRIGRSDEAARFARRRGLMSHRAASSSRGRFHHTRLDSSVALGICRLMAADDRFTEALHIARQWRSFVSAAQAVHAAVEWDVLVAELLFMSGDKLAAQRAVGQAVARAAPCGFLRRFIDEGEPIAGLIRNMSQVEKQPGSSGDQVESFLRELNTCLAPMEETLEGDEDDEHLTIYGKLSGREIEILNMVASGMLNRQIGQKLGLTEGTVKWYLQQVFDKVGVRNRKQAVVRARRLGILAQQL